MQPLQRQLRAAWAHLLNGAGALLAGVDGFDPVSVRPSQGVAVIGGLTSEQV
jgi:hypothetical protein